MFLYSFICRDKDKDLKLNAEEVKDWIIPPDYDHTDAETKHLITEADADKVKATSCHVYLSIFS